MERVLPFLVIIINIRGQIEIGLSKTHAQRAAKDALVVSFAALALCARAANDTTREQINNIPSKSHVIPLLASVSFN